MMLSMVRNLHKNLPDFFGRPDGVGSDSYSVFWIRILLLRLS